MAFLRDYILSVLQERDGRATTAQIVEDTLEGFDASESSVKNELTRLYQTGKVKRPRRGQYVLPANGDGAKGKPAPPEGEAGVEALAVQGRKIEDLSSAQLKELGVVRIPHVTVEADAGGGTPVDFEDVDGATYLPESVARDQFGVDPGRVHRITITGRSMRPTLEPGARVYVITMEPGQAPVDGAIYILRGPMGLLVKRLRFENETIRENGKEDVARYVWLWSDNEQEGRDRLPLEVFQRDYACIAHVSKKEQSL